MNLYLNTGYPNFDIQMRNNLTFNFIISARGVGKTYGMLKYAYENKIKFLFLRSTQTQVDLIKSKELNPFKSIADDLNINFITRPINKYANEIVVFNGEDEEQIGIICGLSTFSNMRGFDASQIEAIIWDEFIPETHERIIKNSGLAFLNAYETINRNRELSGRSPVKATFLGNANRLDIPILLEMDLILTIEKMIKKHNEYYYNAERSISISMLYNSPISTQKMETALYRALPENNTYINMAISNKFEIESDVLDIKSKNLKEYKPIVTIGELTIYAHKSSGDLYISRHKSGSCVEYDTTRMEIIRFLKAYSWIWLDYVNKRILFESYDVKAKINNLFNK